MKILHRNIDHFYIGKQREIQDKKKPDYMNFISFRTKKTYQMMMYISTGQDIHKISAAFLDEKIFP